MTSQRHLPGLRARVAGIAALALGACGPLSGATLGSHGEGTGESGAAGPATDGLGATESGDDADDLDAESGAADDSGATTAGDLGPDAAVSLCANGVASCAASADGRVKCWGSGGASLGQGHLEDIGDDELVADVPPIDLAHDAVQVSCAQSAACALSSTGQLSCWGDGLLTGRGDGVTLGDDEVPGEAAILPLREDVSEAAGGGLKTCILLESGSVRCFGSVWGGLGIDIDGFALGDDEPFTSAPPISIPSMARIASGAGIGGAASNGEFFVWTTGYLPQQLARAGELGSPIVEVSVGYLTCARTADGFAACDLDKTFAVLGTPLKLGGAIERIWSSTKAACVLVGGRGIRCFGANEHGQLGRGNTTEVPYDDDPRLWDDVLPFSDDVADLAVGEAHICALLTSGRVLCMGKGSEGQLGYGSTESVGDDEVVTIDYAFDVF